MTAGDERDDGDGSVDGDGGAPVAGGPEGRAAGVPLTTAHLKATAASGCDGGGGCATSPEFGRRRRRTKRRRRRATRHERPRERGQTKEGDEVVLFIALD